MHHRVERRGREATDRLDRDPHDCRGGQRPMVANPFVERGAVEYLRDEHNISFYMAEIIQTCDIRMINDLGGSRVGFEPLQLGWIERIGRRELNSDSPASSNVFSFVRDSAWSALECDGSAVLARD